MLMRAFPFWVPIALKALFLGLLRGQPEALTGLHLAEIPLIFEGLGFRV